MKSLSLRHWFVFVVAFVGGNYAAGHDTSASYATLRLKPDALELQIKIAADTAWSQVQQTVAPGMQFVLEDFEKEGRALLIKYAQTMEELTANATKVAPREIAVVVMEDNFIFTFTYPLPGRGPLRLQENYLLNMPSDYTSRVALLGEDEKPIASKTLSRTDLVFEAPLPAAKTKSAAGAPPAGG